MVREEAAGIPREVGHEVDDDVVDEDPDGREGYVGERVGYSYSSGTIEGIIRLRNQSMSVTVSRAIRRRVTHLFLENGTAKHLDGHLGDVRQ